MNWGGLARTVGRVAVQQAPRLLEQVRRSRSGRTPAPAGRPQRAPATRTGPARPTGDAARRLTYSPQPDGEADPGEVVWTWVAYEDDPSRGKDRPVLVVGRDGNRLLALMLSSQGERAGDRGWLSLGSGPWDRAGRPSFLRLDRVLEVELADVRREGAVLDRERFDLVADRLRADYGWR